MKQYFLIIFSAIFALVGIITAFMPIPGGVLLAVLGISLLIYNSPKTQEIVYRLRSRFKKMNHLFDRFETMCEPRMPKVAQILAETRPPL